MQIIKLIIVVLMLFMLNGCTKGHEKCVKLVDENNQVIQAPVYVYSLSFFEYFSEILDSHPPMFYNKGKIIAENTISEICFSSQMRSLLGGYRIRNMHFGSFNEIPSKIILKTRDYNTSNNSELKVEFKNFNLTDY